MTWGSCGAGAARSNPEGLPPVLQRILLLPLLTPLLTVLLVAAINPRPSVSVRLLIWSSPALPLSAWLAAAAGLGAGFSSLGTALALQGGGSSVSPRRQVRSQAFWRRPSDATEQPPEEPLDQGRRQQVEPDPGPASWAGPSRGATEPAPTVSVPFRVIRKPRAASSPGAQATPQPTPQPTAQAVNDDWGSSSNDDW